MYRSLEKAVKVRGIVQIAYGANEFSAKMVITMIIGVARNCP